MKDCDASCATGGDETCGGIVETADMKLYDSASACCTEHFDWIANELCSARSDRMSIDKFWPDQSNSKCVRDNETQVEDLSVSIYDTAEACCTAHIGWESLSKCIADTDGVTAQGTGHYYVDWNKKKCVKDCEGVGCGGIAKPWNIVYESSGSCCDQLSGVKSEDCL